MPDSTDNQKYFSGPLNLDRKTKRADTVMGTQLVLDERKFNALDMLVSFDGEPLSFERIYESVWEGAPGSVSREEARAELKDLIDQVDSAGEGFMRIEYVPENGFSFRTHWGHNWQTEAPGEDVFALPDNLIGVSEKPKKRERRLIATLIAGAVAAVAAIVMILAFVMNDLAAESRVIDDATVPLELPDRLDIFGDTDGSGVGNTDEDAAEETFSDTESGAIPSSLTEPFLVKKQEEDEESEDDSETEGDAEDDPETEEGGEAEDDPETEGGGEAEDDPETEDAQEIEDDL